MGAAGNCSPSSRGVIFFWVSGRAIKLKGDFYGCLADITADRISIRLKILPLVEYAVVHVSYFSEVF